ncbi:MAG TPA: hypothetical protein VGF55_12045 [Gemmataceae bacterium]|jgi:hypothetical protein
MARVTPEQVVRRRLKSSQWFDYADPAVLPLPVRMDDRLLARLRPLVPSGATADAAAAVAAQAKRLVPQLEQAVGSGSALAAGAFVLNAAPGTMLGVAGIQVHLLLLDGRLYASDAAFLPGG